MRAALTEVRARTFPARPEPVAQSAESTAQRIGVRDAVRSWWGELTGPTRLLLSLNGVVIAGIGGLAALINLMN